MNQKEQLLQKIESKTAVVGIIGLGYVGLPLALEYANKGISTIGFDIDERKIPILMEGRSYIKHISEDRIKKSVISKKFEATSDFSKLTECDAIIICVPTPLDHHREPDLSFIENSGKMVAKYIRSGQIITLESSTYPGTTEEILLPMFEGAGEKVQGTRYKVGVDFFLAFSPEREDPNNPNYSTSTIPKVVGGVTSACLEIACKLYDLVIVKTVPVSSPRAAEATKLLENIYRSINIALVNELKMVFDRMDIDVWEVIEAAKTKPFGFMPFYPGPGLGGHCIPIDPFYLTWKAREFDTPTRFIEIAGEINTNMPEYVVQELINALNEREKSLKNSKILVVGLAYKKDVDDLRESPSLKLIEILIKKGAITDYYDPYIPVIKETREYKELAGKKSVDIKPETLNKYDAILISTDHSSIDYNELVRNSALVVDTRNSTKDVIQGREKIVKA